MMSMRDNHVDIHGIRMSLTLPIEIYVLALCR